ncbi:MAG: peroxiredoxin family protein [Myxococcales bacterium]|nr:peroxiredoxin family protein [Myxococcales bacterium]
MILSRRSSVATIAFSLLLSLPLTACRVRTRDPGATKRLTQAPDFTLTDESELPVKLADLTGSGHAVLVFYRGHFCPWCRSQLSKLNAMFARFKAAGARLAGISADSLAHCAQLRKKLSLRFPLLSDPKLEVIKSYGVAQKDQDVAVPSIFIVSRNGQIVYRYVGESISDRPDPEKVLAAVPPPPKKPPPKLPEPKDEKTEPADEPADEP